MPRTRTHRRGNYAALFGVSTAMFMGFGALAIDVGWQRVAMAQLGNAADAAAHAGALKLDGTDDGITAAVARAEAIAQANKVHGEQLAIDVSQIVVGRYDSFNENGCTVSTGCWTELGQTPTDYEDDVDPVDAKTANALWVGAEKQVKTFFAMFPFGKSEVAAANYAIARLPIVEEPGVSCAFPLSVPQCSMENWTGSPCGKLIRLRTSNAGQDNMAWSTPDSNRGASVIKEALMTVDGDCSNVYETADFEDSSVDTRLNNGAIAPTYDIISAQLAGTNNYTNSGDGPYNYGDSIPTGWDSKWGACPTGNVSNYCDSTDQNGACPDALPDCSSGTSARMIKRAVTVFDHGYQCDGLGNVSGSFNQSVSTTGYVNLIIYNAYEKSTGPASGRDKYLDAYISCTDENGDPRDEDEDGVIDVIHYGEDLVVIDPPEAGTIAIVE
ncbi:MAG: hypothetical protein EP330_21155 [Deltaproteobacteria bacterium]|nr:MAG: hypothetical protein EP330_21155 [Deltaproteobacteria bacterium]